ncbi:MAG: TatD family hydrolase [Patescibacteria group bacterium]|nr:TatD family hydrolase [Patescibacteria group bacterium]
MLFDTHTHVQFAAFDDDRDMVLTRAKTADVYFANVGTDIISSRAALLLAEQYRFDGVYATAGFHPTNFVRHHDPQEKREDYHEEFDAARFDELARNAGISMIGECGLDYFRIEEPAIRDKEREIFMVQLEAATKYKKPLMIHCRPESGEDAYDDLYDLLKPEVHHLPENPGIIHFFVGSNETAKKFLDLGFCIGFGGAITFRNADVHREHVAYVPLDRIVLETDAPYVAPEPHRGERNEPIFVKKVAEKIAEVKRIAFEEVEQVTFMNATRFFNAR